MTDRELLELAAKAAGLKNYRYCPEEEGLHACIEYDDEDDCTVVWMPHLDDGDALRLAVKLRLSIIQEEEFVLGEYLQTVEVMSEEREDGSRICIMQSFDDDPMTATRRSIVRAAAEIGKAMQ
jgi:hypothetical protein